MLFIKNAIAALKICLTSALAKIYLICLNTSAKGLELPEKFHKTRVQIEAISKP